jgi:phosphoribosylanthranilate isomerase
MVRVKICGITSVDDAIVAVDAGADALGFVFFARSPRNILTEEAAGIIRQLPPLVQTVGLFVNEDADVVNRIADECGLDIVQLHGDETPAYCDGIRRRVLKAFRVQNLQSLETMGNYRVAGYLLDAWKKDAYGGTGHTFDWELAKGAAAHGPLVLAGGLDPGNVAEAVRRVRPYAVDVSSGVESAPGKKDRQKVQEFISRAKEALREIS